MRRDNGKGGEYLTQLETGTNSVFLLSGTLYVMCSQKMLTSGKAGTWEAALRIYCPEPETGRKSENRRAGKDFTNELSSGLQVESLIGAWACF